MGRVKTSTTRATTLIAVALSMLLLMPATSAHARKPNYTWQLFEATNDSRARHGVHALGRAHRMSDKALAHSRAMARSKRLWHSPGPVRYGARCYVWGENVGWTSGDVPDLQRAFMASSDHRRHILERSFRRAAVGAVRVNGKLWVTVFFCT